MKIILDAETTGINTDTDEILQLTMIDENKHVVMNSFLKPISKTEWPQAETVNHISPESVKSCDTFDEEFAYMVLGILMDADEIIGYNHIYFDMPILKAHILRALPDKQFKVEAVFEKFEKKCFDVMYEFKAYEEMLHPLAKIKRRKLIEVAEMTGFTWDINAHNSLGDCLATLHAYNFLQKGKIDQCK